MADDTPYRTYEWKRVRLYVLGRDFHRCQIKGPKCKGRATHVDHIVDWRDGGPWYAPSNLRSACATCNIGQRNSRVAERARRYRDGRGHTSLQW